MAVLKKKVVISGTVIDVHKHICKAPAISKAAWNLSEFSNHHADNDIYIAYTPRYTRNPNSKQKGIQMKTINRMRTLLIGSAIAGALLLSGCAGTAEQMRQQGYGPEYSQGYADGCSSGKNAGGSLFDSFKKNVKKYDSVHKYHEGWDDGYKQCKEQQEQIEKSVENAQRTAAEQQIARELHKK